MKSNPSQSAPVLVREWTPPGAGGVSVLRVEGAGTFEFLQRWGVGRLKVGELRLAHIELEGERLDEVLLCVCSLECVELHTHGSPPLVQRLLRAAGAPEPASETPGICARARRALADAPCELAARVLLQQAEGAWSRESCALLSGTDAELAAGLERWARRSRVLRRALEPAQVLIAGPVNAGKSTLFNALLARERVIASEEQGSTRDLVQEPAQLGLWPILLADGAGQRETQAHGELGRLESRGQALVREQAVRADWILWLSPAAGGVPPEFASAAPLSVLHSCSDLPGASNSGISTRDDPAGALQRVCDLFHEALDLPRTWECPGAAVAFDAASRDWLAECLRRGPAARRAALEGLQRAPES